MWGFGLGGAHSLALIPHVALMGLLGILEVPVHIVYGEPWPGGVVTVPNTLEPRCFGRKPCVCMEVSHCAHQAGELIHVVYSLPCYFVGIKSLDGS